MYIISKLFLNLAGGALSSQRSGSIAILIFCGIFLCEKTQTYFHSFPILRGCRYLKFSLGEDWYRLAPNSQYQSYWLFGDTMDQGSNNQAIIGPVYPEYFGVDTRVPSQHRDDLSSYGEFHYKDKTVVRSLIFMTGFPMLVRRCLYIGTDPGG